MASPTSLQQLKEWVLRELGSPVITINISEQQLEDRIDDALKFWQTYHYEGYRYTYIAHKLTADDLTNKYIAMDPNIISVERIFKTSGDSTFPKDQLFNPEYQLRLNDLWDLSQANITGYVISRMYIAMLDDVLNTNHQFRYEMYDGKLYIDADWVTQFHEDQYIMIGCYMNLDPESYPRVYGDRVFRQLACAYARRQWGNNLDKFQNVQLPGGLMMNGSKILANAEAQIAKLEADFIKNYQKPVSFFVRITYDSQFILSVQL